jgi:hypothetical protein
MPARRARGHFFEVVLQHELIRSSLSGQSFVRIRVVRREVAKILSSPEKLLS